MTTKILMTYSNTEGLEKLLNHPDFQVDIKPKPTQEQLAQIISGYDGLLIRSEVKVTKEVLDSAKNLKLVVRAGTGVDNIDIPTATQKGIVAMNVPGGNTISAAEHTMGLILALSRNIPQAYNSLKSGQWKREKFVGTELQGKTLGLIGLGRIGKEVAKRAQSFEMKVIAYDPFISEEYAKTIGVELKQLDELFAESDYISIHTPKNEQTKNLINKETIAKMKPGVRIINCARGGIVDENALISALKSGHVKGAALDVFEKEPLPPDSPLLDPSLENLIFTPHLGASTEEAQIKIAQESSDLIIDFFTKGIIRNAVNMPSVDIDTYKKIKPYLDLNEAMGSMGAQLTEGGIQEVEITYSGEITAFNTNILTPALLKGILTPILDIKVNFVNAGYIAKDRGIKIKEIKTQESIDYTSLINVKITTDKEAISISGTVFSHQFPRIVSIKELDVDVQPEGYMIILENIDKPGIIGKVGTILGENKINIARMQVGREKIGGEAITVINIDNSVNNEILKKISKIDGITKVKFVQL
ncbi:MAG: phosphoglycerate dehydrogenase [Endomicrobiia bacterium]